MMVGAIEMMMWWSRCVCMCAFVLPGMDVPVIVSNYNLSAHRRRYLSIFSSNVFYFYFTRMAFNLCATCTFVWMRATEMNYERSEIWLIHLKIMTEKRFAANRKWNWAKFGRRMVNGGEHACENRNTRTTTDNTESDSDQCMFWHKFILCFSTAWECNDGHRTFSGSSSWVGVCVTVGQWRN